MGKMGKAMDFIILDILSLVNEVRFFNDKSSATNGFSFFIVKGANFI